MTPSGLHVQSFSLSGSQIRSSNAGRGTSGIRQLRSESSLFWLEDSRHDVVSAGHSLSYSLHLNPSRSTRQRRFVRRSRPLPPFERNPRSAAGRWRSLNVVPEPIPYPSSDQARPTTTRIAPAGHAPWESQGSDGPTSHPCRCQFRHHPFQRLGVPNHRIRIAAVITGMLLGHLSSPCICGAVDPAVNARSATTHAVIGCFRVLQR